MSRAPEGSGRLRAIAEFARASSESTGDIDALLTTIARRAAVLLDVYCCVALISDDGAMLLPAATYDRDLAERDLLGAMMAPIDMNVVALLRRGLESTDIDIYDGIDDATMAQRFPDPFVRGAMTDLGLHHVVLVPMRAHGKTIGLLTLARHGRTARFTKEDFDLARSLADLAALAISNARLLAESGRQLEDRRVLNHQLGRVAELARDLAESVRDRQQLFDKVAQALVDEIGDMAIVRLVSEDGNWLETDGAIRHRDPAIAERVRPIILGARLAVSGWIAGRIVTTHEPFIMAGSVEELAAKSNPELSAAVAVVKPNAMMFVSLRTHRGVVGVAGVLRNGAPFTVADLTHLQRIALHAAQAIENAQLFESSARENLERRRLVGHLRLLSELSRQFAAATGDIDVLLETVAGRLMEVVGDWCAIRMLTDDGTAFVEGEWAAHPDNATVIALRTLKAVMPQRVGEGLTGVAAATGHTQVIAEFDAHQIASLSDESRAAIAALGIRSWMACPLLAHGRVIGVITLFRRRANQPYASEDRRLVEDVAVHASLAISNALLLADQKREIAMRERLATRLQLQSGLAREFAAASTDRVALLELVPRRVSEVIGDACILRMLTTDRTAFEPVGSCFHPYPGVMAVIQKTLVSTPLRIGEGIGGTVAATGRSILANVATSQLAGMVQPGFTSIVSQLALTSIIAVPVTISSHTIGVLSVGRASDRPSYNDEDLAALEDLAAHASLAIENSRLLEAARFELAERTRTEAILRRAFLEAAPDAVLIVNDVDFVTLVNSQAEQLFGYSRLDLVGMMIGHLVRLDDEAGGEHVGVRKDGTTFAAEIRRSRIETPDGVLVATAVRDVTERRRELDERNRRSQEANRLKSEFLANMSHELRTPLNAIIGFTALIHGGKAGPVSDVHKEYLGDILTSSRHLLQLINDVLDLSKIEAGKIEQRVETVDLARVVGEVRDILRGLLADKRMKLTTSIATEIGTVTLDPRLLKQVLYNYLSNAIKFTPESGAVALRITLVDSEQFRIDVTDTGTGIKPQDLGRLFVEFQQIDAVAARRYQGTGLGLALTKRIVEAQHGRVEVTSELGKGSTFSAILPRRAVGAH